VTSTPEEESSKLGKLKRFRKRPENRTNVKHSLLSRKQKERDPRYKRHHILKANWSGLSS